MNDNSFQFDLPKQKRSLIKVVGVGGGGSNAVNFMYNQGIKDVDFVVCNTDVQALKMSPVPNKLQLGVNLTEGLGAGANPEVGRDAAIESKEEIREMLGADTKMLFVTAGMGGGTGTGAAPVIAQVAREMDILTVGIVTLPFVFEGRKKKTHATTGIGALKDNCDTVLVILNDKLREIYGNLSIGTAFAQADNVLTTAAKGIAEIITVSGYVNVDFQDVRTVMKDAGAAVMGSAETKGENRAQRAAEEALASPLLDNRDITGAENILLSIVSGEQAELQMDELAEITDYIQDEAGDSAEVIFGHGVDSELGESIRVTVIATGFDGKRNVSDVEHTSQADTTLGDVEPAPVKTIIDLESNKQIELFEEGTKEQQDSEQDQEEHVEAEPAMDPPFTIENLGFEFVNNDDPKDDRPKQEEEQEEEPLFSALANEFEFVNNSEQEQEIDNEGMVRFSNAKERMERQAQARIERLNGNEQSQLSPDQFKERLDVPAFQRKSVKLKNVPHSSETQVSRYNLNDDNQILGNNKFLHDNVD